MAMTKIPRQKKSNLGDKGFNLLPIPGSNPSLRNQSKNLKYHPHQGQRNNKPMDLCLPALFLCFSPFITVKGPAQKTVPPTFRKGPLTSNYNQDNPLQIHPHLNLIQIILHQDPLCKWFYVVSHWQLKPTSVAFNVFWVMHYLYLYSENTYFYVTSRE